MSSDLHSLQAYLDEWSIHHFSAKELTLHDNPRWWGARYVVPPVDLWPRIIPTLRVAESLRKVLGPLHVVSGYRCHEYNELVGGAQRSQHVQFRALDLRPVDTDVTYLQVCARLLDEVDLGVDLGVGLYDSFVHIDTGFRRRTWSQL